MAERPCTCERVEVGKPYDQSRHCKRCWLFHHDDRYRQMWSDPADAKELLSCVHFGGPTGEEAICPTCPGKEPTRIKLFQCGVYGQCTLLKTVPGIACCDRGRCSSFAATPATTVGVRARSLKWSYGITTLPARRKSYLPGTIKSLASAGFDKPRLFVDGDRDNASWEAEFGVPVTCRPAPALFVHGNWILSLYELYLREPTADRYAVFQDDMIALRNLKLYLSATKYPENGYLNLYTFPSQQHHCWKTKGEKYRGWFESTQHGKGAVGLVFSREAVLTLLTSRHMVERPMDSMIGMKRVDGGILESFRKAGWKEYCHSPTLIQHTGLVSSCFNKPHLQAPGFQGELYDASNMIEKSV